MRSTRAVPEAVWAQLDPRAGQISRRERSLLTVLAALAAAVLATAIWAATTGRINSQVEESLGGVRAEPGTHDIRMSMGVYVNSPTPVRVSAMTVASSNFSVVMAQPSHFVLREAQENLFLHLVVHIRDCKHIARDTVVPVAAVTSHWWGHQSRVLFSRSEDPGSVHAAWKACHGG